MSRQHYAVIEQEKSIKLIPYEKGMKMYQGMSVTVHREAEVGNEPARATLHLHRERDMGGKEREDFDISR